jgi:CubicO group peptidase (beta-lactamase class C family)
MFAGMLEKLGRRARETGSDGFTILRHGKTLADHSFERTNEPVCIMSVTKMVIAVAFGRLLDDGMLPSLDTPVADILPEWRQGRKRDVTVRMILNHTTGLQNDPNAGIEIEPAPDWSQLALCAELDADPGTVFAYNNKAVFLLHPIIQRLTGMPLDAYLRDILLDPLEIIEGAWFRDSVGTPFAAGGLHLRAPDLAKIGQLILDRGTWQGQRIVSEEWIDTMTSPGQAIRPDFGLLCRLWPGGNGETLLGVYHDGWMGQYLIVLPAKGIVISRVLARTPEYDNDTHGFGDILDLARTLAEALAEAPAEA